LLILCLLVFTALFADVLAPLEQEWNVTSPESDTLARVKRLRTAILPDPVHGPLTAQETARRWRQWADLYLAQQLHCYSGDYRADAPTPERLLETVERFEEDLTDVARPHSPMHVVISVGEAIEVAPSRDRGSNTDPVTEQLRSQLESMMVASRDFRRSGTPHSAKA
jgi:hypothetical protein